MQNEINEGLTLFRKNCGIEHNEGNLLANINDELTEILRTKTELELVGELCDVYIFARNGLHQNNMQVDIVHNWGLGYKGKNAAINSYIDLSKIITSLYINSKPAALNRLCSNVCWIIHGIGYDPEKCIIETIKKINSRKGAIDESINKWVKDKNQDPLTLYEPDYDKCKVK